MKIAILTPHLRLSGGNRILFTYANILASRGHEVTVFAQSVNRWRRTVANILQIGKPDWIRSVFRVLRVPEYTVQGLRGFDHVIAGGHWEANTLATLEPGGVLWYMIQHDEGLYHGKREEVDKALHSQLKKIVVSSWLQDVVNERSGQDAHLLLNPYDRKQFYSYPKTPHDTVNILLLDHSFAWKGTEEGIRIVRDIQRKHPSVCLMGLGRRRPEARDQYDEYHFDPPQNQLRDIYGKADIFLCTSWDEGFGLPSLEAMACGTTVATYDNGGSRDFAIDGKTALVAPRRNTVALSAKLEQLIVDPTLRERIASEGQRFVESMPTWKEQTKKFEMLLSQSTLP